MSVNDKLGELLLKKKVITKEQLDSALARQKKSNLRIGDELIRSGVVDLVVNIPKDLSDDELTNDYHIRRAAIDFNIPLLTNARLASAYIHAFSFLNLEDLSIKSWEEY